MSLPTRTYQNTTISRSLHALTLRTPQRALVMVIAAITCMLPLNGCSMFQSGSNANTPTTERADASDNLIEVRTSAQRLGLQVRTITAYTAMLYDDNHTVYIAAPPTSTVNVDGSKLLSPETESISGVLYISRDTERDITAALNRIEQRNLAKNTTTWTRSSRPVSGVVLLDAGHGGKDPGAPNRYGPPEKTIVLDTTLRVQQILNARGVTTLLTRSADTYPTLDQRIAYSNQNDPDLYVSIHADSAPNPSAIGFTVYVARRASQASIDAGKRVIDALKRTAVISRGLRRADFKVIAQTKSPAMLIELGYLSNAAEAQRLSTSSHRQKLAEAIADGIVEALRR